MRAGGWADLEAFIDGQVVLETPEFADVEACVAVADALVARLLGGRPEYGGKGPWAERC